MTATPSTRELEAAFAAHAPEDMPGIQGRRNDRPAAILVPLVRRSNEPLQLVLEERPYHLKHHPGEIVFPGGRPEPDDDSLQTTALREAREELGPAMAAARVIGRLGSIPLLTSDFRVHPFVALVELDAHQAFQPQAGEVVQALRVDVHAWLRRPYFDGIAWTREGEEHVAPIFDVGAHRPVFGGTAFALHDTLRLLAPVYGLPLPPLRTGRFEWQEVLNPPRP